MWITKVSIRQPVFATMVMVGLCVLGLFSYNRLGVEQLPDITLPGISISVDYPGASPEAVENDVTRPIENAVNTVSGIKTILSNSSEGNAGIYVQFKLGTDINRTIADVRDKIAQIRPTFPREVKDPLITREYQDNEQPVVYLSVHSDTTNLRDLSTLTEQVIIKELQRVPGVGRIASSGERVREVVIHVRPEELASYGIGINEVMDAIKAENQDVAVGRIANDRTEALVRVEGKLKRVSDFSQVVVARRGGAPVYLSQVADIEDGAEEAQSMARFNGQPAVALQVFKVQDANVVSVGEGVKAAMQSLDKRLPPGVKLDLLYANSDFIKDSLAGVKHTLLEGAVLTILIVFLFLRSWRSTVITGLTLPIAVISTFAAMYAFNFTLNFMTMMALSLCIGLLIDDAIVVRENIVRHLRMGKEHRQAALDGTQEIGLAVMATTFAIVAVFIPVAFMSGVIGKFFFSFGVTVTVAVLISLFVSFTLDPMLSSVWFDPPNSRMMQIKPLARLLGWVEARIEQLHEVYGKLLAWALTHRIKTLVATVILFVSSFGLAALVGTEFIPRIDEGFISVRLTTPVGASLEYADQKTKQVEAALHDFPEIQATDVDIFGEDRGIVRVNLLLKPLSERKRSQKELQDAIREKLSHIPGVEVAIGFDTPIWINVLGPDPRRIDEIASALTARIAKVPGVVDLNTSMRPGTPALSIKPIPDLESDLGLSNQAIGDALQPLVNGQTVGYWLGPDGQNYPVRVQLPKSDREAATAIGNLMLATSKLDANGLPRLVPLREVANITTSESPQILKRQDLQRRVGIYANVQNRPAGDVSADIAKIIKAVQLPPGYQISVKGEQEQSDETGQAFIGSLALAVIFIYLILASQFGSFMQPIAIMFSLPFSVIGVFLALALTGTTVNLFSMIGFIMLMGLVTKNAILLVDRANHGQRDGMTQREALLEAGQVRLRPILMTTAAMVFGMLPLAMGWGGMGAEQQAPMGRAIIGGVLTSTLLTLVVVPVIYSYLDVWGRRVRTALARRSAARRAEGASLGSGAAPVGQPAARRGDESGV